MLWNFYELLKTLKAKYNKGGGRGDGLRGGGTFRSSPHHPKFIKLDIKSNAKSSVTTYIHATTFIQVSADIWLE